ncbi:sulfonate transport system permease protein [Rhizobium sp. BK313]|uniref:ABC transporter permease n=1 Tax=Rhizobium sp. BK313 TaxID=2587081 RepID=UPI00105B9DE8|nr:ABC transporter permease [Rhizobium sp. BK313]MBB3458774.1 sulfonate transport system permease protein [Rhizobium sp. BK313]
MSLLSFSTPSDFLQKSKGDEGGRELALLPKKPFPGQTLLGPALVLLLWYVASGLGWISPAKMPGPIVVASSFLDMVESGTLASDVSMSLQRAGIALVVGVASGFVLAILAGLTRLGDALIDGNVQVKRSIPNLALIPLFIIWLGIGEMMKVSIIAIGVAIPIYINTHAALRGIDRRYVELGQTVGLSNWRFLRHIVFPASLPGFFTGLRLAVTSAWTALVVVETVNATSGIGYMITQARTYGQTDVVLVGLVIYGVLGFGSDAIVRLLEGKVLSWR